MDDKDWAMLKIIKEEGNLTKTAQRMRISQPALSYRLLNLEQEFGVKILNRNSNGISFTLQGEYILKCAEELIDKLKCTKEYVQIMENQIGGCLRLGVSTTFAKFKMAPILQRFKSRYPDIQLILQTGSSTSQLPEKLQKQDIDIAILRGDFSWPEEKHTIFEEPICLIYSKRLEFDQLPALTWIQDEPAINFKASDYLPWWQDYFSAPVPPITIVDSTEACIQFVSYGFGWAMVPKMHLRNHRSLFSRPIFWRNGSPMTRKTVMVYKTETFNSPAVKVFVDYVLRECSI